MNIFGEPVSRTFTLQGFTVQFFQRGIVQLDAGGRPRLLNDDGDDQRGDGSFNDQAQHEKAGQVAPAQVPGFAGRQLFTAKDPQAPDSLSAEPARGAHIQA